MAAYEDGRIITTDVWITPVTKEKAEVIEGMIKDALNLLLHRIETTFRGCYVRSIVCRSVNPNDPPCEAWYPYPHRVEVVTDKKQDNEGAKE